MKANARRSRSFDSGATRMPRMPDHHAVARRRSRRRRQKARPSATTIMASMRWFSTSIHSPLGAHEGAVIGGGVEILRRAAVALHFAQRGVAAHRPASSRVRAASASRCCHRGVGRAFPPSGADRTARCWCGRCGTAPLRSGRDLDHLVEDLLHDVGIDQVAFGFDDFL